MNYVWEQYCKGRSYGYWTGLGRRLKIMKFAGLRGSSFVEYNLNETPINISTMGNFGFVILPRSAVYSEICEAM